MSKNKLNIGVVGCANISERFVIPAINELSDIFNLVAVASRDVEKANRFAKKFKTQPLSDYQTLIEMDSIDAVYIPLPNALHYKWIKKALENNKHVLVEKSMACSFDEVKELNHLAESKQLVLLENFQFRFHSQLAKVKEAISSGIIGELRNIRVSFGFPPFKNKDNIRYSQGLGGGALLDVGAYPLKVAQELVNGSLSVDSASLYYDSELGVDIWGAAQLKTNDSKVVVQAGFGFDNYYQCSLELWGSKAMLKANRIFTSPPGVKAELIILGESGEDKIVLKEENHFVNMLLYFYNLVDEPQRATKEYSENISQSKLISELRAKADE